ncbi:MAG: DUF2147 domain-containing protein [Cyclobacteriaceae bacterium]|nr:DUF2147 domain-containing protein [Cyclobacteriaceae bacterium]
MKSFVLILTTMLWSASGIAQNSVLGKWKSIDDKTGQAKSIIEITERDGKVYGKIIKIFPTDPKRTDPVCDKCPTNDSRYNKKIFGMEIMLDMKKDGDEYSGGNILDPEVGKIYRCKIWVEGNELKVRGYLGPFYRTQSWLRV